MSPNSRGMCRLKIEELTERAAACSQSSVSEGECTKRLELAMTEMRQQMQQQEQQREVQYAEKLTALKQEASAVKHELKARLLTMDSLCEQLRAEKETAIAELEERHRLRLLSVAESQEEQVMYSLWHLVTTFTITGPRGLCKLNTRGVCKNWHFSTNISL